MRRDVKLPFTVSGTNEFQGRLSLNRRDYNVGQKSLFLSDNVMVNIHLKLAKGA